MTVPLDGSGAVRRYQIEHATTYTPATDAATCVRVTCRGSDA